MRAYFSLLPLLGFLLLFSCKSEPEPIIPIDERLYLPTTSLKAKSTFPIGVAIKSNKINDPTYAALVKKEFSSLSAEYEMKQDIFMPDSNVYSFTASDALVDFAQNNGLRMHGHALVWHNTIPVWLQNFGGTDAEFELIMKDYIQTVVSRYRGRIASWDVVNEGFNDGSNLLRNSIFRQRMGDNYIEKCIQWAHESDPDAILFYNDYNLESDGVKRAAVIAMINDFKARGIPINGFGFQMHISHNSPSIGTLTTAINELVATGLKIHFSEMDVRANPNNDLTELTLIRAQSQEERYRELAALYKTIPAAQQFGMTFWGVTDNDSWLIPFWGNVDWPLLFDVNYDYKLAHRGMINGL